MLSVEHAAPVSAVAFAASGKDVVSGAVDGSVIVTRDSGALTALPTSSVAIDAVGFLPDGRVVVASVLSDGTSAISTLQFGGNPSVLGSTLMLNDRPRTIVGIMPPRFMFRGADVYLPIAYRSGETPEGVNWLAVTARRKTGVTAAQAEADLGRLAELLGQVHFSRRVRHPFPTPAVGRIPFTFDHRAQPIKRSSAPTPKTSVIPRKTE